MREPRINSFSNQNSRNRSFDPSASYGSKDHRNSLLGRILRTRNNINHQRRQVDQNPDKVFIGKPGGKPDHKPIVLFDAPRPDIGREFPSFPIPEDGPIILGMPITDNERGDIVGKLNEASEKAFSYYSSDEVNFNLNDRRVKTKEVLTPKNDPKPNNGKQPFTAEELKALRSLPREMQGPAKYLLNDLKKLVAADRSIENNELYKIAIDSNRVMDQLGFNPEYNQFFDTIGKMFQQLANKIQDGHAVHDDGLWVCRSR